MDKTLKMSLLFDFYGQLLTKRQQDIFEMYFHEDLSLGEISDQLSISRQAVYDMLKRSTQTLEDFELKLGLVARHQQRQMDLDTITDKLSTLSEDLEATGRPDLAQKVEDLAAKVQELFSDS